MEHPLSLGDHNTWISTRTVTYLRPPLSDLSMLISLILDLAMKSNYEWNVL